MERTAKDWFKILLLFLPEAVIIAVVLVIFQHFDIKLELWVMILGVLLLALLAYVTYRMIMPSFHVRQASGREGMIGMEGEVVEALNHTGIVRVEGELWKARSVEYEISAGEIVEIQSVEKLMLEVRRKSS